ncbi:MAG TPA: hypothetical protein VGM90_20485 [Kofleriaceae bacterium]|jgi:hypothetical protein
MRLSILGLLVICLTGVASADPAPSADRTATSSVTLRGFGGPPNVVGVGVGYARDLDNGIRIDVSAGWLGAGDGSTSFQWFQVHERVFECWTGRVVLLLGGGLAHFQNAQTPDGYDTHISTIAATTAGTLEFRPRRGATSGFTASVALEGALAIEQDKEDAEGYRTWEPWRATWILSSAIGYAF